LRYAKYKVLVSIVATPGFENYVNLGLAYIETYDNLGLKPRCGMQLRIPAQNGG
jgi:hypothetical protein